VQKRQPNPLGRILDRHLQDRHLSHAEFARLVGIKKGTLSAMRLREPISGLPKCLDIDLWSKTLNLSREEMKHLILAAAISYSPLDVQLLLTELGCTVDNTGVMNSPQSSRPSRLRKR